MSSGAVQSVNDANERSRQTPQPYQSPWLAHWKRAETDCNAAGETSSVNASVSEKLDCVSRKDGLTKGLEASSRSANGLTRIRNGMFGIGDDFIKAGRKRDNRSGSPMSRYHSLEEDTSENPPKLIRTCSAIKDSFYRLTPLQERCVESLSRSCPHKFDVEIGKFDKGKTAVSVSSRQTDLLCERKVESLSQSDNSSDECFRESISCSHCSSTLNRAWLLKMQNCSSISLFQSRSSSSEENGTTKSHNDCHSQLKLQKCVHVMGTMRNCSAIDVPDLLITEKSQKTEVNVSKKKLHSDAGNRWVKRLKMSSSNSNVASSSSHERTSKLFIDIPNNRTKEDLSKIEDQPNNEGKALSLSHAWIQRLLHSRRIKTRKSEVEDIFGRERVEKLEKEKLPSIEAMALMAKALTCFQECVLQKKGSYTIWNTKTV